MKTKCILFAFFLSLVACGEMDNLDTAVYGTLVQNKLECMNMLRPADSYDYPVYPGMPEWTTLRTRQEMSDVCQIPESILGRMSTQAVIQALWEHPLFVTILDGQRYQMDFSDIFSQNNAYRELLMRQDAGSSLIERLERTNFLYRADMDDPYALNILASQNEFLSQLNDIDKKVIIKTCTKNDELIQKDIFFSNNLNRSTIWLLIGKILVNANYAPFIEELNSNQNLMNFINDESYVHHKDTDREVHLCIDRHALNFMN